MKNMTKILSIPLLAIGTLLMSSTAFGLTFTTNSNTSNYGNPDATNLLTVGIGTSDVGYDFTLFYDVPGLSSLGNALTAEAKILITDFSFDSQNNQTTLKLDITLKNTIASPDTARIISFGMVLDPNATSASIQSLTGPFDGIDNGALPAFNAVNQCAFGGSNCQGGGNQSNSIVAETDANFVITFLYNGDETGGVNISQFPIKWQSAFGDCSYETSPNSYGDETFASYETASGSGCGGNNVPEPGSTLLLFGGLGLMLAGYRRYIN